MPIIEATAGNVPVIEDGLYPVTCVNVEQTVMENDQYGNKNKLRFKLEIEGVFDEDGEQVYLDPLLNEKLSLPDAKMVSTLTKWAAVFGVPILNGRLDTDGFKGKRAQALIETEKEGDWPRVKNLMALKKGQANAAPSNGTASAPDTFAFLSVAPNGDAQVDWTKFWAIGHKYGLNVKHVEDAGGKPIDEIDPYELPLLLEKLIEKAQK